MGTLPSTPSSLPVASHRRPRPIIRAARDSQVRSDKPFRLAVGTFKEDTSNTVEIVQREWWGAMEGGGGLMIRLWAVSVWLRFQL